MSLLLQIYLLILLKIVQSPIFSIKTIY